MLTLEQLLERVLAFPEAGAEAAAAGKVLRAFRDGDRSLDLVERMRAQFRRGGVFFGWEHTPAITALAWTVEAAMSEIGGPGYLPTKASAIRYAEEALAEHEREQRSTNTTVQTRAALLGRAREVQGLLREELGRRGMTLEGSTPAGLVECAAAVRERTGPIQVSVSEADAAAVLREFGWTLEEERGIWWNPLGGGYTLQEALSRVVQTPQSWVEVSASSHRGAGNGSPPAER